MKPLIILLFLIAISATTFAQENIQTRRTMIGVESRKADTNTVVYDSLGNPLRYYQYMKLVREGTHSIRRSFKPGIDSRPTLIKLSLKEQLDREKITAVFNKPKTPHLQLHLTLDTQPLLGAVKTKEIHNQPIVLVFWSADCWPCTDFFAEMDTFIQSLADKDITVLALTRDPKPIALEKLKEFPFASAKHIFNAASIFQSYQLNSYPTLVVTNKDHVISYAATGVSSLKLFKAAILEASKKN